MVEGDVRGERVDELVVSHWKEFGLVLFLVFA